MHGRTLATLFFCTLLCVFVLRFVFVCLFLFVVAVVFFLLYLFEDLLEDRPLQAEGEFLQN